MAFLKCLKYWILSAEGNSCVKASTMLLSLSVQNVFRSVIEGSILFRELAKYFLWQKQLPVLDLYRTNMRSMSSFFINKHWGSKWCHCHINPPVWKSGPQKTLLQSSNVSRHKIVQHLWFICQVEWLQFLLMHFSHKLLPTFLQF